MPTKSDLEEVNLLFLEASGEHTDKTALEIMKNGDVVDGDSWWNTQAQRCYDSFIKALTVGDKLLASKRANELYYKHRIDVTADGM